MAKATDTQELLIQAVARLDRLAMGIAVGAVCGLGLFAATLVLVLRGGENVGANLGLLVNYFPGYNVTLGGSILGLGYGFLAGFVLGYTVAALRNGLTFVYVALVRARQERAQLQDFLDRM